MRSTTASEIAALPTLDAVVAIRSGLPAEAFYVVARIFSLSANDLAMTLGVSVRTVRDQRKRRGRLSKEITEKLVRAARIHALTRTTFTTDAAASQWLASPAPALDGQCPLTLLDTHIGSREVESILQGFAHGNVM